MKQVDWKKLPEEVRSFLWDKQDAFVDTLYDKYKVSYEQREAIFFVQDRIILKIIPPLDLPKELECIEGLDKQRLRLLALDICYKILWPLNDYIGDIDKLILRLGGQAPKAQPLKKIEAKEVETVKLATVKTMMDNVDFKALFLSSNKIINKAGKKVSPTVENWLEDYIHFLGAGKHSSLQRAQYFAKSPNALSLSKNDKDSLRFFLVSYDQNTKVKFDTSGHILSVSEIKKEEPEEEGQLSPLEALKELQERLKDIDKTLLGNEFILSETEGDLIKLRDILWQAIGLQDKDKVIGCLRVLIDKRLLDRMLIEDKRYKNILKRFIDIRYGSGIEIDDNIDKLLTRRLFFEMLFVTKLHLEEPLLVVLYLTNIVSGDSQLVYFDENDNQLKWLELQVVRNRLAWIDKII